MADYDVLVIGGGIAGAGLAAMLAGECGGGLSVAILEMEAAPGYHTTGRSAAFFAETYGGPDVQPLTTASRNFLEHPPEGFGAAPLITPRGCLHIAEGRDEALFSEMDRAFAATGVTLSAMDGMQMQALVPGLGRQWVAGRYEPGCADLDVSAIHQGFLRLARKGGTDVICNAEVRAAHRAHGMWMLETAAGDFSAGVVAIAAGAWADKLAAMFGALPLGIRPLRRTVVQADVRPGVAASAPIVMDIGGRFYFRPDAGGMWICPHDETVDVPGDVQPEELDVAIAIDRFEKAGSWQVVRKTRAWAGLRNFSADRLPVYGFDPHVPGLFWCAGQGGFGIQTSPAASMMAAAVLAGRPLPGDIAGLDPGRYAPDRFFR